MRVQYEIVTEYQFSVNSFIEWYMMNLFTVMSTSRGLIAKNVPVR